MAQIAGNASDHTLPGAAEKRDDLVVFITRQEGKCAECGEEFFDGSFIRKEGDQVLCLQCADLAHLEYLPRGNTALTRRATKYSPLRAVVVQWSRARKRFERQGILVAGQAIDRAEVECVEDAGAREQQRARAAERRAGIEMSYVNGMTDAIRQAFPGCPPEEARQISEWTCQKNSGRVGRSAAAKTFEPDALKLAVVAHIRHEHTEYDELLMSTGDRQLARQMVRSKIDRVLDEWVRTQASNPAK